MEKKNFFQQFKMNHNEVVEQIKSLMESKGVAEVDLLGSSADHAFVIGTPDFDWDVDYMEMEVSKVYLRDGKVLLDVILDVDTEELAASNENGDIGEAYKTINADDFMCLVPCAGIDGVYESVWQVLVEGK